MQIKSVTAYLTDHPRRCRPLQWLLQLSLIVLSSGITARSVSAETAATSPPSPPPLPPPEDLLEQPLRVTLEDSLPLRYRRLPTAGNPLAAPNSPSVTPTPSKAAPDTVPSTLKVERFEVVGSTIFSPETLAKVLARFTKRPISYAELLEARSAITQLYVDQGYTTSGAFIPPQALLGGVVKIQVLEGGLEALNVTGNKRLNSSYVRKRLVDATSKPLNTRRLLEALQLLQLNPLIENLSAELSTGARPGTSLLQVRVNEAQTSGLQFATNNGRSPSVGSLRQQLQFTEANLLGLGDDLSLAYAHTSGSDAFDVNYTLPINSRNGTISLGYGTTSSNVIEAPFDELDIEAESRYYDLTLRQPLIQTPSKELTLGLQAVRQESETSLLDTPFPLSLGADARGDTRISAVRFFQEWTSRNSREVVAARSQFSFGVGAFNATVNDDAPDSRFFAWRGQAQWLRLLAPDTVLLVRGDVQLAGSPLVPLEQFGLGGQASVRGYRQDAYLSDSGVFASAELRLPILRLGSRQSVLQLIPFVDVGTVWNNSGRYDPDPSTLASVGLGLQWQPSDLFSVRVDWGIPLVSISSSNRTWQENGLYFSVNYTPF